MTCPLQAKPNRVVVKELKRQARVSPGGIALPDVCADETPTYEIVDAHDLSGPHRVGERVVISGWRVSINMGGEHYKICKPSQVESSVE